MRSLSAKITLFTSLLLVWVVAVLVFFDVTNNHFHPAKAFLMFLIIVLVAGALGRFTIRQLVRPLALLKEGIESVVSGRLEPIEFSRTGDEIQYLGESFNRMIRALAASQEEIRRHQETLEQRILSRTEQLEEAMLRAQQASRAKSEFLANMSHELRTPMNGFLGMIDVVLDSELTHEQREQLMVAQSSAISLLALLNDILDLSKIEAGRIVLEKIPFDPRDVLESCAKTQLAGARQKGITVSVDVAPDVPRQVIGDPLRFRQIAMNLLNNAVKFTERGVVRSRLGGAPAEAGFTLVLEVADTGPGIAPEVLPHIFEKFTQAEASTTRRYGGTGLGLAITQKLVDLHGGQITVESTVGKGSRFVVSLPLGLPDPAAMTGTPGGWPAAERSGKARRGNRILLVEDNLTNQKVVAGILRKRGFSLTIAHHGQEAVELLDRLRGSPDRFDLVLMDVQMPYLDGLATTRWIRSQPEWQHLPIVAMTAYAMTGDRERCLAAGMNGYLSKPVNSAQLLAAVNEFAAAGSPDERVGRAADAISAGPPQARGSAPLLPSNPVRDRLQVFLQKAPGKLSRMQEAVRRCEIHLLRQDALHLRSGALRVDAQEVAEWASRLEEAAASSELTRARHALLMLERALHRLGQQAQDRPPDEPTTEDGNSLPRRPEPALACRPCSPA